MNKSRTDSRSAFGAEVRSRISSCWKTVSAALAVCFAFSAGTLLRAETFSSPSTYTYYDLKTVNKVRDRDEDKAFWSAAEKGENEPRPFLSTVKHLINSHDLPKTIAETWKPLDATKFTLAEAYGVRAYFVGSDTSYNNSLGFNTTGQGVDGAPLLIFPNASTAVKFANADSGKLDSDLRTTSTPLFPGDFVDLSGERGMLEKGTNLDFFLIRDGFNTQPKVGSAPDILSAASGNLVAFAQADNPYVLISFEDGSGSNDYSDTLFAIDMGANNVNALLSRGGAGNVAGVPAPEPGVIWALVLGAGTVLHRIRRKRTAVTTTSV
jgi:hypothetical protein